ncbi:MAG: RdgB/HAM1 family non-canonical purine NTP pyrophosphatase [Bacteroidales bacterium]|nr:RdgB/HAM1 family non-canonical purine NTP pyrophosphatase [Bacteroidales bacterium]
MKLIFATGNAGKLREAREILGPGYEVLSPAEAGLGPEALDVEETGATFAENAHIKAAHIKCGLPVFADDSGLEVDALNGEPGIYTARYAGVAHDSAANIAKLLRNLKSAGAETAKERKARFRCAVALIIDGRAHQFEGSCEGHIAHEPAGDGGFGYDPVFVADAFPGRTLAQVPEDDKNGISHRGEALRKMAEWLRRQDS